MTNAIAHDPINASPRLAGALYLAIAVLGGFSIGYVPSVLVAAGDPVTTATNIANNTGIYRMGIFADIGVIVLEVVLSVILFAILRPISPVLATIALVSRAAMALVMAINLMLWSMPLVLTTGGAAFERAHMVFFQLHDLGIYMWQVFFAVHLLALGAIILRSNYVPHLLGWGLFIGSFGYLFQGMAELMSVQISALNYAIIGLLTIVTISELAFAFWLLIAGPKRLRSLT